MKKFITPYIYNYAKKVMPKISETEAAALNSGTVSIDGNIFNGNLKIKDLINKYNIELKNDEKNFLNNYFNTF